MTFVTIVVLLILAGITISYVMGDNSIFQKATDAKSNMNEALRDEKEALANAEHQINSITNKKPQIRLLKCSNRTASQMNIVTMATDEDKELLEYTLYVGTSKDNLVKQVEVKEKIVQGTEVSWKVDVIDDKTTYYYKVVVKDRYSEIESEIRETNNAPVLGTVTIEKGLDETKGNWVSVKATATDVENDKLTYTFKMWKKEDGIEEEILIGQTPTKIAIAENKTVGEQVELAINERLRRVSRLCI